MKKIILFVVLLNGISPIINAQHELPLIADCDSIEVEAIYPDLLTVCDISNDAFDRISQSRKKMIKIRDSKIIKPILDSINTSISHVTTGYGIDIRGKIVFYLSDQKKIVFYVGLKRIQFIGYIFHISSQLPFNLLYLAFSNQKIGLDFYER